MADDVRSRFRKAVASLSLFASLLSQPQRAYAAGSVAFSTALARALKQSPEVLASREGVAEANSRLSAAQGALGPYASAQLSIATDNNTYQTAALTDPERNANLAPGITQTSGVGVVFQQPIYAGGRLAAAVDLAQATEWGATAHLIQTEEQIAVNLLTSVCDVTLARNALDVLSRNREILLTQLHDVVARVSGGQSGMPEVYQIRARLADVQAQISVQQAVLAAGEADLGRQTVGLGADVAVPDLRRASIPTTLEGAISLSLKNDIRITITQINALEAKAQLTASQSAGRPAVNLQVELQGVGGSYGYGSPFSQYNRDISGQIVAQVPLFSNGQISANASASLAGLRAAESLVTEAQEVARSDAIRLERLVESERARVESEIEAVKFAEDDYRSMQELYRHGLKSLTEVLLAQREVETSGLSLATARRDLTVADGQLSTLCGSLLSAFSVQSDYSVLREDLAEGRVRFTNSVDWAIYEIDRLHP